MMPRTRAGRTGLRPIRGAGARSSSRRRGGTCCSPTRRRSLRRASARGPAGFRRRTSRARRRWPGRRERLATVARGHERERRRVLVVRGKPIPRDVHRALDVDRDLGEVRVFGAGDATRRLEGRPLPAGVAHVIRTMRPFGALGVDEVRDAFAIDREPRRVGVTPLGNRVRGAVKVFPPSVEVVSCRSALASSPTAHARSTRLEVTAMVGARAGRSFSPPMRTAGANVLPRSVERRSHSVPSYSVHVTSTSLPERASAWLPLCHSFSDSRPLPSPATELERFIGAVNVRPPSLERANMVAAVRAAREDDLLPEDGDVVQVLPIDDHAREPREGCAAARNVDGLDKPLSRRSGRSAAGTRPSSLDFTEADHRVAVAGEVDRRVVDEAKVGLVRRASRHAGPRRERPRSGLRGARARRERGAHPGHMPKTAFKTRSSYSLRMRFRLLAAPLGRRLSPAARHVQAEVRPDGRAAPAEGARRRAREAHQEGQQGSAAKRFDAS